jgi:hypothetical protein
MVAIYIQSAHAPCLVPADLVIFVALRAAAQVRFGWHVQNGDWEILGVTIIMLVRRAVQTTCARACVCGHVRV